MGALSADDRLVQELSHTFNVPVGIAEISERYRTTAMKCLEQDQYLWNHNVTSLQALIILVNGLNHVYGQTFTLAGLTIHLAFSIGCHIDPERLGLDTIECEERRRCWAALMMLYTWQNVTMGNLGASHTEFKANTKLPADLDDEDIVNGRPLPVASFGRPTQMSYMIPKFRLFDLGAEMSDKALRVREPASSVLQYFDQKILAEQKSWDAQYRMDTVSSRLPAHLKTQFHLLWITSLQLRLLLHRSRLIPSNLEWTQIQWSRECCLQSAERLLDIHAKLHESPEFAPYGWFTRGLGSFYAFHAVVVLATLVKLGLDQYQVLMIKDRLDHCLERFQSLSKASRICAKAAPVIRSIV